MDFPAIFAKIEPKANLRFDLLPLIYQLGSDCGSGTFVHCYEPSRSSSIFVASNSKSFSERLTAPSNFDAKSPPNRTALAESLGWTGVAPPRTFSRAVVRCRISGERG